MAAAPPRRQPQRTCVSCRRAAGKRELIRLVRTDTGVAVDESGHAHGRGAYLCHDANCWTRAASGGVLQRALRLQGPLPAEVRTILEAYATTLPAAASEPAPATDHDLPTGEEE